MAEERIPAIKLLLLPKDTNALGTIFGGVILSHIDLASAVEARKAAAHRYVTKAMREVEFLEPVFLGDIVSFYTETMRVGRTSITVKVSVEAERWGAGRGEKVKVTEAEVVLVAIGPDGRPVPVSDHGPGGGTQRARWRGHAARAAGVHQPVAALHRTGRRSDPQAAPQPVLPR